MRRSFFAAALLLAGFAALVSRPMIAQEQERPATTQEEQERPRPLAHMVYFTLAEDTPANREALVEACRKYLTEHEGTVHFSVGIIGEEFDREVNEQDWQIALNLIFRNKEAHDVYQTHPRHLEFIETSKHLWSKVRVFDSYVVTPLRERRQGDRPRGGAPREGRERDGGDGEANDRG